MGSGNRVRITGGRNRGARVEVPPGARPTSARVREALFSIWAPRIERARFLDLFAGSGVVGLEALSRGAAHVRFVEGSRAAVRVLKRTCGRIEPEGSWEVAAAQISGGKPGRWLEPGRQSPFDLAFVDPPYDWTEHEPLIAALDPQLAVGGQIALEHSARSAAPERAGEWVLGQSRGYGETSLSFYLRKRDSAASVSPIA